MSQLWLASYDALLLMLRSPSHRRPPHRRSQVDVQLTCCAALARIAEPASRCKTLLHTTACEAVLGATRRFSSDTSEQAPTSATDATSKRPEGAQVCTLHAVTIERYMRLRPEGAQVRTIERYVPIPRQAVTCGYDE